MTATDHHRGCANAWRRLAPLLLCLAGAANALQDAPASATREPLPTVPQVAAALSDPALRANGTLDLVAVAALNRRLEADPASAPQALFEALVADRAWLDGLQLRFGTALSRSPVLDPAAWHLQRQLDAHGLPSAPLQPALGPDIADLLGQLFNRADPRQAVAVLPQVLWHLEVSGTGDWAALLERVKVNPALSDALRAHDWSSLRGQPPKPAKPAKAGWQAWAMAAVSEMTTEAVEIGPPDPRQLSALRFGLLSSLPGMPEPQRFNAAVILHLADLIDGLNESRYMHFAEGLLASVAALDWAYHTHAEPVPALATWLAECIALLSASYSQAFNMVDPRLNSAVAAAFDVTRSLARDVESDDNHQQLADAVARLALMVPDMDFYFDLPVRDPVAGGVDACTGIVAVRDPDGSPAMTRAVFDDCQQTLVNLADVEAREAQLAGDPNGPFGEVQLERELRLAAPQRVNYGIGYLHERYATGCMPPPRPLPNPLEWAYLATFMAWMAEQSPVYFQTPENEQRLSRMRGIGAQLINTLGEQVDCLSGTGTGINDPVQRASMDYAQVLADLGRAVRVAERAFRATVLAPGADIALDAGPSQPTAYRPADVSIGPCELARACEMDAQLSATRAMYGLFPDAFLVADQSGLGKVEICYDNMEWVERRASPVRKDDPNVANYYGHLAFDLRGRFVDETGATELFGFRFVSPEEHHYMFAAAAPEVLVDSCPVEWLGQRIVSTLGTDHAGIVPNRLTYLSAPRTLPSRLLSRNWDRGAEWRDWFVTGLGVQVLPVEPAPDLSPRLEPHLSGLYHREQESIYRDLLGDAAATPGGLVQPLSDELRQLSTAKSMLRLLSMLFYPQTLNENDDIRAALAGQQGLLDAEVVTRMREENMPVSTMAATSTQRLAQFQEDWQDLPEAVRRTGSVSESLAHALVRLNALHARHFQAPATSEQPPESPSSVATATQPGQ